MGPMGVQTAVRSAQSLSCRMIYEFLLMSHPFREVGLDRLEFVVAVYIQGGSRRRSSRPLSRACPAPVPWSVLPVCAG